MDRAAKAEFVTSLHEVFRDTGVVVVAHYAGLSVAQMSDYRERMREAGGKVKVAKNRLAKIALKDTDVAGISDLMKGPTCLAYSDDPVAAAKVAVEYAKGNDKLVILGGAMGQTVLTADSVKAWRPCPLSTNSAARLSAFCRHRGQAGSDAQEPGAQLARIMQAKASQTRRPEWPQYVATA